jgi:hypothetical protein
MWLPWLSVWSLHCPTLTRASFSSTQGVCTSAILEWFLIKKYSTEVTFNVMTFLLDVLKICQFASKLLARGSQTARWSHKSRYLSRKLKISEGRFSLALPDLCGKQRMYPSDVVVGLLAVSQSPWPQNRTCQCQPVGSGMTHSVSSASDDRMIDDKLIGSTRSEAWVVQKSFWKRLWHSNTEI